MTDIRHELATSDYPALKLLLAEDEPVQRRVIQRMLEDQGYHVDIATSGDDALERVLRGGVQVVLTDWDMPGMDGAELCRRIRAAHCEEYVYILMITAHLSPSDMVFALRAGANDYLRKPLDEAELLARLWSACELVGVQAQLRAANAKLERMARIEPALRCYNRRYLNTELPREVAHAVRHQEPLALLIADLDNFKRINDTYGHLVGDEVLGEFVERVNSNVRSSDWIARYGGEEFAIVLRKATLEDARGVAEKVRSSCADELFGTSKGLLPVTVSLGVASSNPALIIGGEGEVVRALIAEADAALYRAKQAGRNRVSV